MPKTVLSRLVLVLPASLASAQGLPPAATMAPLSTPPLVYSSPFAGYQPFREQAIGSWREAMETVDAVGGWRAYAREAQSLPGNSPAAPVAPAVPSAGPHGGHR